MIIRCVTCKKEFEQKSWERKCGCLVRNGKYSKCIQRARIKYKLDGYFLYMQIARTQFQNPIYQWFREFVSTEDTANRAFINYYIKKEKIITGF